VPRSPHDTNGGSQGLLGVGLIGTEGQVYNDEASVHGPQHGGRMIDHLIEGDGECGFVACHYIGGRVADKNDVDACCVEDPGE